ncbi:endonuclease/exonuclease/phosphatase family protein [Nemania sp. FL0916]|nr:endonuclease/exonuclease/phosphatase family protein [Nemania sp. FL0916]
MRVPVLLSTIRPALLRQPSPSHLSCLTTSHLTHNATPRNTHPLFKKQSFLHPGTTFCRGTSFHHSTRMSLSAIKQALDAAIQQVEAARKPASAQAWEPDKPHEQAFYAFDDKAQTWRVAESNTSSETVTATDANTQITKLALFSWNIDFMLPHASPRMRAALSELQTRIAGLPPTTAVVVFLQECVSSDLEDIGAAPWVRKGFVRTDLDSKNWASGLYGTTTLVDRRLKVGRVFRAHFEKTRMERDALFVDVCFPPARCEDMEGRERKDGKIIRLCNTHLESLAQDPPYRPPQVALAAKFMKEESVHGALLAGDLNAIQPFDRTLHTAHGLSDAYLSLGGVEDSDEGYTWGQQAAPELRRLYGCSRMDKVWFCGGVTVDKFARFGADVEVAEEDVRKEIVNWGGFEKGWVTDHLGVWAEVRVV